MGLANEPMLLFLGLQNLPLELDGIITGSVCQATILFVKLNNSLFKRSRVLSHKTNARESDWCPTFRQGSVHRRGLFRQTL